MKIKNLVCLLSVSLILAACGGTSVSLPSSVTLEESSSREETPSSSSIESEASSSSSKSSSYNGVHNYQQDLEDISVLLKNVVSRDKTFTVSNEREYGPSESIKTVVDEVETKNESSNMKKDKITLVHNGKDGTGYTKIQNIGADNAVTYEGFVANSNGKYKEYSLLDKKSKNVDADYLYYASMADYDIIQLANLPKITLSYFEKYYMSPESVREMAGDDLYAATTLRNFTSSDFAEENGVKKIVLIYGTSSLFKGSKLPVGPDRSESLVGATFDCQFTLTVEWTDAEIKSISSVYGYSYTTSIDNNKGMVTTKHDSYSITQLSTIKASAETYPSYSTTGYTDEGNVKSCSSFYVPLKSGEYGYGERIGLMDDNLDSSVILGSELAEAGLGVNVYLDYEKTKKVDLTALKFKSYDMKYYIDFVVPKDKSYVIVQHAFRSKDDIKRGDLTFKISAYTSGLEEVTSSWTPANYIRADGIEFQSTGLEVLVSSDRFAKASGKTIVLKAGNYYVVKNSAEEI